MANGFTFELKGSAELKAKIRAAAKETPKRVAGALYLACEVLVMTRSKDEFVPVRFTTLQSSGKTELPEIDGRGNISVKMSYGGAAAAYALVVHETPSGHDPPAWVKAYASGTGVHFTRGGPEYLLKPLLEAEATILPFMAERLKL